MTSQFKQVLSQIPAQTQRQDSTMDQLQDLLCVAVRLGMYDAHDAIKTLIKLDN